MIPRIWFLFLSRPNHRSSEHAHLTLYSVIAQSAIEQDIQDIARKRAREEKKRGGLKLQMPLLSIPACLS